MKVQATEQLATAIPARLGRDPIVEALCEIRFEGGVSASSLLPGLLQPKFGEDFPKFEKLPAASLPEQVRELDPNLQYAPLYRLSGAKGMVSIGERSLSVAVTRGDYPGWKIFKPLVVAIFSAAIRTGHLGAIQRLSVKFVNVFAAPESRDLSSVTRVAVNLGDWQVCKESIHLRTEIRHGEHVTVVQIANPAQVSQLGGPPFSGLVLDIDTVLVAPGPSASENLGALLDAAHDEEKRVFFGLLSPDTLKECEPHYE